MKKISLLSFMILLFLAACDSQLKFKVEGNVKGAGNKILYLESSG